MDGGLSFEVRSEGDVVVVAVSGEIDMATAPQLAACLNQHIDRDVTVDLAGVGFMDSSGLSVLVAASKQLRAVGGRLYLTNEQDIVRRILEVTGLDQVFHDGQAPGRRGDGPGR